MPPALGIVLVMGILGALIGGLRWLQRRFTLHPELARKCVHVLMGLVALSFPWIFNSAWPVFVAALLAIAVLGAVRCLPYLKSRWGPVLGGVGRDSLGELYFPVAVALVFWLADGDKLLYCVPILVLALADAVGALVGTRYGLSSYTTDEGRKSYEGSLAFFIVAFFAVHIPVLLATETGRADSLLTALTLALLVTLMEALAWRGLDNFFIPLTSFFALDLYLRLETSALVERFAALVTLTVVALVWRRHTTLTDSSALGSAVFGYIVWTLAGWQWLAAPLILFLLYTKIGRLQGNKISRRDIQSVIRVMAGPMVILFVAISLPWKALALLFYATFGAHLANVSVSREHTARWDKTPLKFLLRSVAASWILYACAYIAAIDPTGRGVAWAAALALPITLSAFVFYQTIRFSSEGVDPRIAWLREGLLAPACAIACLLPLVLVGCHEPA
jgi:phytol kinase